MTVNLRLNYLFLDCDLTRYLLEASKSDDTAQASFAAVLITDLGYYDQGPGGLQLGNLRQSLENFSLGNFGNTISEMGGLCGACSRLHECNVGAAILKR